MNVLKPIMLLLTLLMLISGCSTKKTPESIFSEAQKLEGNTRMIPASLDDTWNASMELVGRQGFNINEVDTGMMGKVLGLTKEIKNKDDDEISHSIKATITLSPVSNRLTRVTLSANQTTELHKKSYIWWHLLWMIPLIPIDTEYTNIVTDRDTIKSSDFYDDFFSELLANVKNNH